MACTSRFCLGLRKGRIGSPLVALALQRAKIRGNALVPRLLKSDQGALATRLLRALQVRIALDFSCETFAVDCLKTRHLGRPGLAFWGHI